DLFDSKKNGVALYKSAMKGEVVEREAREIEIYSLSCKNFDENNQTGILEFFCSNGT
ncbi:MAG: tRNA pseudouridine(55) synthase TruB, partial [Lentisphaeria bacterium]